MNNDLQVALKTGDKFQKNGFNYTITGVLEEGVSVREENSGVEAFANWDELKSVTEFEFKL
jgi:hypothetical protein